MLKRIIVAYDGSTHAREAFAAALAIAPRANAGLLALRVIEPSVPLPVMADPVAGVDGGAVFAESPEQYAQRVAEERRAAERDLHELEGKAAGRSVPFEKRIAEGVLLEHICAMATPDDLIAVGLKGRFSHSGIGSSTRALVQKAPCPVLVAEGPGPEPDRILAAYDGASGSKKALCWARDLAAQASLPLTVLALAGKTQPREESASQAQTIAPGAALVELAHDGQSPAKQIEAAATHAQGSILVMGAYAESWLHRLIFGGTTEHVLAHVKSPVVLVH